MKRGDSKYMLWKIYSEFGHSEQHQQWYRHCKSKFVVSTTARVVTLIADNWRDSGHERFALVLETIMQHATQGAAAQFFLQLQYTENVCASLTWLQVPYCNFEMHL